MAPLPPTSETRVGGRVVFLIDESEPLRECIAGGTKSKAESIATALNSLLNQLVSVADLEVAVAGYRGDPGGGADVGCRWGGPLAGRRFVPTTALADAPLAVENRVRRLGVPRPSTGCPGQAGGDRAVPHLVRAAARRQHSSRAGLCLLPAPGRRGNDAGDGLEQTAPGHQLRGRPAAAAGGDGRGAGPGAFVAGRTAAGLPRAPRRNRARTLPCSIRPATSVSRRGPRATCSAGRACCRTI